MNRKFRLRQANDFKRVRRSGKSYAHPLVVLVIHPAAEDTSRFGITAARSIGNAVQRNRVKRKLREALRPMLPLIKPGWNVILISRRPILQAKQAEIQNCLNQLFFTANLIEKENGN